MPFLEANEITIQSLLSDPAKAYKVPIYQRPYVWNTDQWQELLDDIMYLKTADVHFLGSIVIVPEKSTKTNIEYFQVVDGQQRLATILIWLASIRDIFNEKGNNELSNFITDFLFLRYYHGNEFKKVHRLELGEFDRKTFSDILEGKNLKESKSILYRCYSFFKEKTDENIWTKLLQGINIVNINVFSHLNAFRLFETLNDRGLELSSADLIKNFILMNIADNQKILDVTINEWNEMYEKVKNIEPVKYLRHYILSKYKGKISEKRLYEKIKDLPIMKTHEDIKNFTIDLNEKATIYKRIYDADYSSNKIKTALKNLHLVEVLPSYSLLLKVFNYFDDLDEQISEDDIFEIIRYIETFHIRWGICGQYTGNLDQIYNNLCIDLSKKHPEEYKEHIINVLKQEMIRNVDDDVFKKAFINRSFNPTEKRTKYILYRLSIPVPTYETTINIEEIHTEHIMPKKLSSEWIAELQKSVDSEKEVKLYHEENLNKIGNLTIIKGKKNQEMLNKLFKEKKDRFKESEIGLTKELLNYGDEWNFQKIFERCKDLYEVIEKNKLWSI